MDPDLAWRRCRAWTIFLIIWTLFAGSFLTYVPALPPLLAAALALAIVGTVLAAYPAAKAFVRSGWRREPATLQSPEPAPHRLLIVILMVLAAGWGGYVLSRQAPAAWRHVSWDRGSITVAECSLGRVSGNGKFATYHCSGEFTAENGRYSAQVEFRHESNARPTRRDDPPPPRLEAGERISALAPGPGATRAQAVPPHSIVQQVAGYTFMIGNGVLSVLPIVAWTCRSAIRSGLHSRRPPRRRQGSSAPVHGQTASRYGAVGDAAADRTTWGRS